MVTRLSPVQQEPDSGYPRLEHQIAWYDRKSIQAQWWFKRVKLAEFVFAVIIPFSAKLCPNVTAAFGGLVILLEAVQQINQWSQNWITYRSTCEALRHEKYSYLGRAGVYEAMDDESAKRVLVERVESLISTEHAKWISRQEYKPKETNQRK